MENNTYTPCNDSDDLNPAFLMHGVAIELLVAIANGQIDVRQLAKDQLGNSGRNEKGEWVGFKN